MPSHLDVRPPLTDLRRGKLGLDEWEETLYVAIEFDRVLTKTEKASVTKLYADWTKRIIIESAADEDFDGDSMRIDALFIGDKTVRGGVSRFIAASDACVWLVGELRKLPSVVSVVFGDPPDDGAPLEHEVAPASDEPPEDMAKLELVANGQLAASLCFSIRASLPPSNARSRSERNQGRR
ncbi:MAG: hypothetical protein FWD73_04270 [Polyangiaceae bacterium]|nr:hypothetical protein [Polyangiaceae bacterium]